MNIAEVALPQPTTSVQDVHASGGLYSCTNPDRPHVGSFCSTCGLPILGNINQQQWSEHTATMTTLANYYRFIGIQRIQAGLPAE